MCSGGYLACGWCSDDKRDTRGTTVPSGVPWPVTYGSVPRGGRIVTEAQKRNFAVRARSSSFPSPHSAFQAFAWEESGRGGGDKCGDGRVEQRPLQKKQGHCLSCLHACSEAGFPVLPWTTSGFCESDTFFLRLLESIRPGKDESCRKTLVFGRASLTFRVPGVWAKMLCGGCFSRGFLLGFFLLYVFFVGRYGKGHERCVGMTEPLGCVGCVLCNVGPREARPWCSWCQSLVVCEAWAKSGCLLLLLFPLPYF